MSGSSGSVGSAGGVGTGSSSSATSGSSSGSTGSSASSSSASGRARSNATAQYMPHVLGCACHAVRAPGPPPPPNDAAMKAKAKWTDGVTPQRASDAISAQSAGAPMMGGARVGSVPASPIKTGKDRPDHTAPKASGLDMETLRKTVANAIAARRGYRPTPEQEASDLTTELNRMLQNLDARLSTEAGRQGLQDSLAGMGDDPLARIIGIDMFAARLAWSDAGLAPDPNAIATAQSGRDDAAYMLKNAQTEAGRAGYAEELADAEARLQHARDKESKKREILANGSLTPSDRVAILGYTVADYKVINGVLRGTYKDPDGPGKVKRDDVPRYVGLIKSAMEKLPAYSGTLGRSAGAGSYDSAFDDDFTDSAFTSTSMGKPAAGAAWTITINGATEGRDISVLSAWQSENEVLLPPGSRFIVDKANSHRRPRAANGASNGGELILTAENNVFGRPKP